MRKIDLLVCCYCWSRALWPIMIYWMIRKHFILIVPALYQAFSEVLCFLLMCNSN